MKKANKIKTGLLFGAGVLLLTGCTNSFCTIQDVTNLIYEYETRETDGVTNLEQLKTNVRNDGYLVPSDDFFVYIEEEVAKKVKSEYSSREIKYLDENNNYVYYLDNKTYADVTTEDLLSNAELNKIYVKTDVYHLTKFAKAHSNSLSDTWSYYTELRNNALEVKKDDGSARFTLADIGSNYFYSRMRSEYSSAYSTYSACITPVDRVVNDVKFSGKSWGDAWGHGLFEGLIEYPIALLIYYFSTSFSSVMGPFGYMLAILLVTIIVRGFLLLVTFKQTMSQQRMTDLQPELAKLQQKYPDSNTNQYQKQAMAQEQMALYKKHKVNPFGMFIVLLFQFPIFISVWGAMSQSVILTEGEIFTLKFTATFWGTVTTWNQSGTPAAITAIVIFVLMSIMQALSVLLPQYLQKKRTANVEKLNKSPAADKTANQMKMMNYVMLAMIIFMGATLPIAMAIYWFVSALVSLCQSLIMSNISNKRSKNKNKKKDNFVKYRSK